MRLIATLLIAGSISAQEPGIHVTAAILNTSTAKTMFGPLPKQYSAVGVEICNDTPTQLVTPLARIVQRVKLTGGISVLPRDAALSVIAAAQGSSKAAIALRWSVAAIQIAAIATSWSGVSESVKATLNNVALAGTQSLKIVSNSIPTHTYLTFDHEALPDMLTVSGGGCISGISLIETIKSPTLDIVIPASSFQK